MTLRVSGVQLNFLQPAGLEISNDPPSTVDVILTGSKDKLDRIGPRDLIANVDLSDQKAGERLIKLTLDRVNRFAGRRKDSRLSSGDSADTP